MTKEHRENLAKNAKQLCTKAKDKLRDVHNTFLRDMRKKKDEHSSDLVHNVQEYVRRIFFYTQKALPLKGDIKRQFMYINLNASYFGKQISFRNPSRTGDNFQVLI